MRRFKELGLLNEGAGQPYVAQPFRFGASQESSEEDESEESMEEEEEQPQQHLAPAEAEKVLKLICDRCAVVLTCPLGRPLIPTSFTVGTVSCGGDDSLRLLCRLTDEQQLKAARVHPLQVLMAQGALTQLGPRLSAALDLAFERSFANVAATGKRVLLALDVSGSMSCPCNGAASVTCATAAAAIAMILVRKEVNTQVRLAALQSSEA